MKKRMFCQMAAGAIGGILLAKWQSGWLFAPLFLLLLLILFAEWRKQRGAAAAAGGRWFAFYMIAAFCTALGGYARECSLEQKQRSYEAYVCDGGEYYLCGQIKGKEEKNEQSIYELSSCQIGQSLTRMHTACGNIQVSMTSNVMASDVMASDAYSIGENLVIKGKVSLWQSARNEGNFDAKSFYQAKGLAFQMKNPTVLGTYGKAKLWKEQLYQWKRQIKKVYQTQLPDRECGILTTMILGDKSLLEDEVKSAYQMVGISHILAISGLHISIVGMFLYRLLRRCGMGFWSAGICAAVLIIAYGEMTGFGTSVFRAVLMFLLIIMAQAVGRSYDSLNALGVAAVLLLFENPEILFYAGFQFSFGAVLGVLLLGGVVKEDSKGHACFEKILMGAAMQCVTLPMVAWYYYEIPVYAVAVNLLVVPLMSVVLPFGMAGGVLGCHFPLMAKLAFFPCRVILGLYQKICDAAVYLPNPVWTVGRPSAGRVGIYYGLLLLVCYIRIKLREKERKEAEENEKKRETKKEEVCAAKGQGVSWKKTAAGSAACALLLLFLFVPGKKEFEMDVLDVGQGDGIFLRTAGGYTLFLDGGSTDVSKVGTYRIAPFLKYHGVKKVDYWVVSHTDKDHISGLSELLELGYPIENLLLAKEIEKDAAYDTLKESAEKNGTKVVFLGGGDVLHLQTAKFTAVSPNVQTLGDKNAKSLVLLYEEDGFSGIFTGDISEKEEQEILKGEQLGKVDFYKAAHHGSKYSNSEAFLRALAPAFSVISCSERNRYGHPGAAAVEHMQKTGSSIYYTMYGGQIKVTRDEKGQTVVEEYLK